LPVEIATYEADNSLKKGYFSTFEEISIQLKENRWLIYQLFRREFLTVQSQSLVGVLWVFLMPLISVGMFVLLNRSGIFNIGNIDVPYPIYAILGMAFWQFFAVGLRESSDSLVRASSMIVRINFPKKVLVIAAIGKSLISFLFQFVIVLLLFLGYRVSPSSLILLLPVFVIPILLLTVGLGFIVSLLNSIMRDVGNLLSILIMFLMFCTPVLYSTPTVGRFAELTMYNPLFYLVSVPRELILTGSTSLGINYLASSALSFLVFLTCLIAFHLTETRIAERI
jgi:lipopolysaccharide transport system permease protein